MMQRIFYILAIAGAQLLHGAASEEQSISTEFISQSIRQWPRPKGYEHGPGQIITTNTHWEFPQFYRIMHSTSADDTRSCGTQSLDGSPAVKDIKVWTYDTDIVSATRNYSGAGLSALRKMSGFDHIYQLINEQRVPRRLILLESGALPSMAAINHDASWLITVDAEKTINLYDLQEQEESEIDETFSLKAQSLALPRMRNSPSTRFTLYTQPEEVTEPLHATFAFAHTRRTKSKNIAVILHHMVMLWRGASGGKIIAERSTDANDTFSNGIFSPDDTHLYFIGNALWRYNCSEGTLEKFAHPDSAHVDETTCIQKQALAVSPYSDYLAVAHVSKGVSIFQTATMQIVHQLLPHMHCTSLDYGLHNEQREQLATSSVDEHNLGYEELWEIRKKETPTATSAHQDATSSSVCIVQ